MINNFWFYLLITPIVISILALNSLFVHKSPSIPVFENALEYCQNVDNNNVYSDQGTAQDICIDEYWDILTVYDLKEQSVIEEKKIKSLTNQLIPSFKNGNTIYIKGSFK